MPYKQIEESFLSNVQDVMNGYNLSRNWFNFRYDNPEKCKAVHTELYLFIVDLWNRLGQKKKFGLSTFNTMELLNIGSRNTYYKVLKDLEDFGFIKTIQKSENQHQSRIIAISKIEQPRKQSLDQANTQASEQPPIQPREQSHEHIDEQETSEPYKQLNNETKELFKLWLDYRKEIKKTIKSKKTLESLAERIKTEGYQKSKKVIETSIQNGWQGLFWEKVEIKDQKSKFEKGQDVILQYMINDPECQNDPAVIEYRKNNNLGTLKLEQ